MCNIIEKYLVDKKDVNVKDDEGKTPLHSAAEKGNLYLTAYLLSKGADLNAQDEDGWTPLHYAAYLGNIGVVKLLVDKGTDPSIADYHHEEGTPMFYAFQCGWTELVKYFSGEESVDSTTTIQLVLRREHDN